MNRRFSCFDYFNARWVFRVRKKNSKADSSVADLGVAENDRVETKISFVISCP